MKQTLLLTLMLVLCSVSANAADVPRVAGVPIEPAAVKGPTPAQDVILDCDPGFDMDDMSDLALLNEFADQGELNILAVMSSLRQTWSAADIEVVMRYYGRPNVPIGVPATNVYAATDVFGTFLSTNYFNGISNVSNALNSISLYRQILARRPNNSVTIIVGGQLHNIADLWNSSADSYSVLSGQALMTNKVKRIIVVAGIFPNTTTAEYNVWTDVSGAAILNSMTNNIAISYMGIEQGNAIQIGGTVLTLSTNNPVREAYRLGYAFHGGSTRASWTGLALMFAARGYDWRGTSLFTATQGYNTIHTSGLDGSSHLGTNTFTAAAGYSQEYLTKAQANSYYISILDGMLMRGPLWEERMHGARIMTSVGPVTSPAISTYDDPDTGFNWDPAATTGETDFIANGSRVIRWWPQGAIYGTNSGSWWTGGGVGTNGIAAGIVLQDATTLRAVTSTTTPASAQPASIAVAGVQIKEGSNAKMGTAILVAGTVTVNTTAVTANSRIFLENQTLGGTAGFLRVSARTAGTSFAITSSNAADTSTIAWMIVEPAP